MLSVKFVFDYFAIVQPMVQVSAMSARLCEALAPAPALALALALALAPALALALTLALSSTR